MKNQQIIEKNCSYKNLIGNQKIGNSLLEVVRRHNRRRRTNRVAPVLASSVIGGDSKNEERILLSSLPSVRRKKEGGSEGRGGTQQERKIGWLKQKNTKHIKIVATIFYEFSQCINNKNSNTKQNTCSIAILEWIF